MKRNRTSGSLARLCKSAGVVFRQTELKGGCVSRGLKFQSDFGGYYRFYDEFIKGKNNAGT